MEKLQAERASELLAKHGTYVTIEQAKIILEFMNKLADLTVTQLISNDSRFICSGKH